uniref:Uncharacterized protein n=1 Tax=Daphnia galeata TaxID=27404 RepID=A0A8J2RGJ5_9CRUS|nr:unnamed protein product [Daphnia galeata]
MENPSTYSDLELFTRELTWDTRTTISKLYSPSFFWCTWLWHCIGYKLLPEKAHNECYLSCIQRYIAFVAVGVPVGIYADQALENRLARKDAVLVHYMRNHPEDFPETGLS